MKGWTIALLVAVLGVGIAVGRWSMAPATHDVAVATEGSEVGAAAFTCAMHPQIRQPKPGKCPICGMDLIPVRRGEERKGSDREITLSKEAWALARIATVPVERRVPDAEIRLFGRVVVDESRVRSITARFPARIERLYVNYTGVRVQHGEHLARIYSPELLTAQAELLSARRFNEPRALRSAREKLSLWGLSPRAIAAIEARSEPTNTMDIDAPLGGFVVEKLVSEGDYVETGSLMFRIADLAAVWVVLDAYEIDKPWLRFGQEVTFTADALPGHRFEGRIAFLPPVLDPESRTFKVRVNLANEDLRLRPGMFVTGIVHARIAGDGVVLDPSLAGKWISPMHPEIVKEGPGACDVCGMALVPSEQLGYAVAAAHETPLVVPASAVLRTGRRAIVYVEVPARDEPTYEGREIDLGPRAGDSYVVAAGLAEGERVVVNGAFKLDSALQLLARPSMMTAPERGAASVGAATPQDRERVAAVLSAYLPLWRALAADDLAAAHAAATRLVDAGRGPEVRVGAEILGGDLTVVATAAGEVGQAADLDAARRAFERASDALIRMIRATGVPPGTDVHLAFCPMAFEGRRAEWLQDEHELRNPYFGAAMLRCGEFDPSLE